PQPLRPEQSAWTWPVDDQTPVDITSYYVSKYSKGGLSYWVGAARSIGSTAQDWEQRRKAPIAYLLKVGSDAIHERLYYRIARALDLPQQHVFWAVTPPYTDLVAAAIQFEPEAFFPKSIDVSHIPQFKERKNRIDKRQGQADGEHVDEEVVAPGLGFAIVIPYECGEDQSPQSTERSSAWLDGQ